MRRPLPLATAALGLAAALAAASSLAAQPRPSADPFDAVVREALAGNLALAGARRAADREDAAVREARARYRPTLAFSARYTEQSGAIDIGDLVNPAYRTLNQLTGTNAFPTDVSATLPLRQETKLRLVQPLWQPALGAAVQATRAGREVHVEAANVAARRVAAGAQLALVDLGRAAQVVALYEATLPLVREHERVAERLVAAGAATPEVVSRAAADRAEVEQALAEARRDRADAARLLNDLLGRPLDAPVEAPDSAALAALPAPVPLEAALASARGGREELRQAEAGVQAAHAQERLARAATLPGVALAVDYGVQGRDYRFGPQADVATASLVVSWDLYTGGQAGARESQAALDADRMTLARRDLARTVEREVRAAHEAAQVARAAIATADARLAATARTYTLVRRRWEEGIAPQLELVDARVSHTTAGLNAILTRHAYAARWIELERAAALRALDR